MPQAPRRPTARARGPAASPRGPPPIMKLFVPEAEGTEEDAFTKEANAAMKLKVQMDFDLDVCRKAQEKELHDRRLKDLKELLKTVAQDDWQYASADKLIGLQQP